MYPFNLRKPMRSPRSDYQASRQASSQGLAGNIKVLRTRENVKDWRCQLKGRVALVPTMGNLHEGHLELVDIAKRHSDNVVVSIFVNPAQFAAGEDFDRYPRTLDADLERLRACGGVSAVLAPAASEIFPRGSPGGTAVVPRFVQGLSEDSCRPHFFTGVATVCLKLFNLCQPDVVVFGQKDAMQCAVIANMLDDLLLADCIQLVVAPTSRESDGLARSSRNSYLTPGMREAAPAIFAALMDATSVPGATSGFVRSVVHAKLVGEGMEVEYVSIADGSTMAEKDDGLAVAGSVVSVACLLREGGQQCRLIDNVVVPLAVF
jgi:pantoate--beta-alanine ligase